MSFYLQTLEGEILDLSLYGIIPKGLSIDSLSPRNESDTIDGRNGNIEIETTYEGRSMRASFLLQSDIVEDYSFYKGELYKLFDGKTYFYIIDLDRSYRRWKVRTTSKFLPERINPQMGIVELDLISQSPYCESNGSTLNHYWEFQLSNYDSVEYTFENQTSFRIWNDGDIAIDPREHELKINFSGTSDNLTIRNITNGDEWVYNSTTSANDQVEINGIKSKKNGSSIFGQTNKKLIILEKGWNDFEISGASVPFTISFDIKFLYIY